MSLSCPAAHDLDKGALITSILERAEAERLRHAAALDLTSIRDATESTYDEFLRYITDGAGRWKIDIPGKPILKMFCSRANIQVGRLKNLYFKAVEAREANTFNELTAIFSTFSNASLSLESKTVTSPDPLDESNLFN